MNQKGFAPIVLLLIITVVSVIGGALYYTTRHQSQSSANPIPASSVNISANTKPLFGTMLAFNINDAAMGITNTLQKGWTQFKNDNSAYQKLKSNLKKNIQDRTKLVKATGFSLDRELIPYFTWNIIEPQKGQFDWELTDLYVQATLNTGVKISAVIQPFASWDQKNTSPLTNCNAMDFAYFDYKIGPPNDLTEYVNFLTKTVERYKNNVAVWEIGNEYDGPCGGYQDNPQGYFDLVKITSETIKKVDPKAIITNGGASEMVGTGPGTISTKNFWTKFFALGGNKYIDYFNFHYNTERSQDAKLNTVTFQETLTFWNELMDNNGGRKPLYLTEFGIYSGSPSSQPPNQTTQKQNQNQTILQTQPTNGKCGDGICDDFEKQKSNACPQDCQTSEQPAQQSESIKSISNQNLPNESQDSQATLYFKDSILAFANGTKVVFIDLIGSDNGLVSSSMAFNTDNQPRLFLATLKMIDSKISDFSKIEKISDGQYKFTVGSKTIYALWSGTLPNEISGQVKVTDVKRQEQTMNATAIKLSADQPVFLELQK